LVTSAEIHFPDDPADFEAEYVHSYYPGMRLFILGPTPTDAIAQLRPLVELGVRHIIVNPYSFRTLERFCAEVAPVLAGLEPGVAVTLPT
jgi:hypothetical protein